MKEKIIICGRFVIGKCNGEGGLVFKCKTDLYGFPEELQVLWTKLKFG